MRVFLDTNVWVAAFAARGLCEALLGECLANHELLTTTLVWEKLKDVLTRKLAPSPQSWKEIETLWQSAVWVADAPAESGNNDTRLLEAAAAASANAFVTGDKALLHQRRFGTMPIVSPRRAYERLIRGA